MSHAKHTAALSARGMKGVRAVHSKHPSGSQTKKQLASERANLAKGRAILASEKGWASAGSMMQQAMAMAAKERGMKGTGKSGFGTTLAVTAMASNKRYGIRLYTSGYRELHSKIRRAMRTSGYHELRSMYRRSLRTTAQDSSGSASVSRQLMPVRKHPLGVHLLSGNLFREPSVPRLTGINHHFRKRVASGGYMRSGWGNSRHHHYRKYLFTRKARGVRVKQWRRSRQYSTPR